MNTPVNPKIARILKQKDFNMRVRSMYCDGVLHRDTNNRGNYNALNWVRSWRSSPNDDVMSAPTIAEVVTWIHTYYGYWIGVSQNRETNEGLYVASFTTRDKTYQFAKETPEAAYEAAFLYFLTTLA